MFGAEMERRANQSKTLISGHAVLEFCQLHISAYVYTREFYSYWRGSLTGTGIRSVIIYGWPILVANGSNNLGDKRTPIRKVFGLK